LWPPALGRPACHVTLRKSGAISHHHHGSKPACVSTNRTNRWTSLPYPLPAT
jgi:hypothetical protein